MVDNRGNATAYIGGTSHRPLPRPTQDGRRTSHQEQAPKPASTFDWDWNKATCTSCQTKITKTALVDGRCGTCRGEKPANKIPAPVAREHSKSGDQVYVPYDEDELAERFEAPASTPTAEPQPELPSHDGTRLGRSLAELERDDPKVAAAARSLDDAIARITRPDDHVRPENLTTEPVATSAPSSEVADREHLADLLELQASLRTTLTHLDRYLAAHQTPAAPTSPRATAPRATPPSPPSPGLGGDQPAADSLGEVEQRPARSRSTRPHPARRPSVEIDEAAVVRQYVDDHDSSPTIARRHGVRPKRIRQILLDHGVQLRDDRTTNGGRNRITHTPETIADVVRRYTDEQQSMDEVEAATGIERRQVSRILADAGVTIRPPAHQAHPHLTAAQAAAAVDLYLAGTNLAHVGNQFGVRAETVRALVIAAGHTIRAKGSSRETADRVRALGTTVAELKAWALAQGLIPAIAPGMVPARLVDAYEAAHPTTTPATGEQSGDTA